MIGRWLLPRNGGLGARARWILLTLFALAIIAMIPLRLVLGWAAPPSMTARYVDGQIWSGRLSDLKVGPLPLGTVDAGLRPLTLLFGRPGIWVRRVEGAGVTPFRANAAGGADWLRLSDVNGTIDLPDGLGSLPAESLSFTDFRLEMESGRCTSAEGTVSVKLASLSALLPAAIGLSGQARCQDGKLTVPMQGPGGMEHIVLKIDAAGRWTADMSLAGLPVEISGPLVDQGFSARPGGIGIRASGTF